jgi:hypothetical protein
MCLARSMHNRRRRADVSNHESVFQPPAMDSFAAAASLKSEYKPEAGIG